MRSRSWLSDISIDGNTEYIMKNTKGLSGMSRVRYVKGRVSVMPLSYKIRKMYTAKCILGDPKVNHLSLHP